jgi:hypothetical protein
MHLTVSILYTEQFRSVNSCAALATDTRPLFTTVGETYL